MIADARQYIYESPWNLLFPILAIFVTVLGFNVLGDGLRRTLDVRLTETQRRMSLLEPHETLTVSASLGGERVPVLQRSVVHAGARQECSGWSASPAPASRWSAAPSRNCCRPASP